MPHGLQCGATDAAHVISAMPEVRLPVKRFQVFGKSVPCTRGIGCLQIVDERGHVQRGMDLDQHMHMIRFPAELQQCAAPSGQDLIEGVPEMVPQFRIQGFAPILGDNDDRQLERIDGMR